MTDSDRNRTTKTTIIKNIMHVFSDEDKEKIFYS